MTGPPRDDRLGENVVEDLEAPAFPAFPVAAGRDGPHDALARQPRQHRREVVRAHIGVPGEIRGAVRDLRARRRDEVVEECGDEILLLSAQPFQGALQVAPDDLPGAAETLQRLEAKHLRARRAFLVPEPLHDELQVRGFHAPLRGRDLRGGHEPCPRSTRPAAVWSSTASTRAGSSPIGSGPPSRLYSRTGSSIAARAARRSRWSSRR